MLHVTSSCYMAICYMLRLAVLTWNRCYMLRFGIRVEVRKMLHVTSNCYMDRGKMLHVTFWDMGGVRKDVTYYVKLLHGKMLRVMLHCYFTQGNGSGDVYRSKTCFEQPAKRLYAGAFG